MTPRERLLDAWARWVTRHPAATLIMSLLVAAVSILLAATSLELHSDRSDLVSGDLDWSRRYAEYRHDFKRWDDLVLCFEGDPGDSRIDELARQVAERLDSEERIASADAGFAITEAGPRMWKVADVEEFNQALTWFGHAQKIAEQPGPAEGRGGVPRDPAGPGVKESFSGCHRRNPIWIPPFSDPPPVPNPPRPNSEALHEPV